MIGFIIWSLVAILFVGIGISAYKSEKAVVFFTYEEMQKPFVDSLSCMFTGDFYFEYTAQGVNKAKAIEAAYTKLGITKDEMIAYGDAENDLPMLTYVGCGVAMGNAAEAVKEAADEVTLDNNSDGIAVSLEKHGIV